MVIEKVHGLHATSMSLNERFSMIATAVPRSALMQKRRTTRQTLGSVHNLNYQNRILIQQIAQRLQQPNNKMALHQRLGTSGGLRRFGSEGSLAGLQYGNSYGNLSVRNRVAWKQSNGNLSRAGSVSNMSNVNWRGRFRRRGGQRIRGRFRGGAAIGFLRPTRMSYRVRRGGGIVGQRGGLRGGMRGGLRGGMRGGLRGGQRGGMRGRPRGQRGGPGANRGRGARSASVGTPTTRVTRSQAKKAVPTKEELDNQLDQYMACTKTALDRELDTYMKNAMEME